MKLLHTNFLDSIFNDSKNTLSFGSVTLVTT